MSTSPSASTNPAIRSAASSRSAGIACEQAPRLIPTAACPDPRRTAVGHRLPPPVMGTFLNKGTLSSACPNDASEGVWERWTGKRHCIVW